MKRRRNEGKQQKSEEKSLEDQEGGERCSGGGNQRTNSTGNLGRNQTQKRKRLWTCSHVQNRLKCPGDNGEEERKERNQVGC